MPQSPRPNTEVRPEAQQEVGLRVLYRSESALTVGDTTSQVQISFWKGRPMAFHDGNEGFVRESLTDWGDPWKSDIRRGLKLDMKSSTALPDDEFEERLGCLRLVRSEDVQPRTLAADAKVSPQSQLGQGAQASEALAGLTKSHPGGDPVLASRIVSLDDSEERLVLRAEALMLSNDWSLWHSGGGCFAMRRDLPEPFDHALLTSLIDGANIPLNGHDEVILGVYNADDEMVREYQGEFELVLKTFRLAVLQPADEKS